MSLTSPVTRDEFSYAGDFYVEASGHNRHRRATVPELKAHFKPSGDGIDHPAHWYEAQLIHYGLKPSKTKGTAKMRLFEAVHNGNIAIPAHLSKVEADLKKEWAKKERQAKQALKTSTAAPSIAKGTKRKAEEAIDAGVRIKSMFVRPDGFVDIQFNDSTKKTKRTKTATSSTTTSKPKAASKSADPKHKTPAVKASSATAKASPKPKSKPEPKPLTGNVARRGGGQAAGKMPAARKPIQSTSKAKAPALRAKPTAKRRGTASRGGSRGGAASASKQSASSRGPPPTQASSYRDFGGYDNAYDEPPPPYPGSPGQDHAEAYGYEYDDEVPDRRYESEDFDDQEDAGDAYDSDIPSAPLGLLNGRYELRADSIHEEYGPFGDSDFGLIATLEGDTLWGSFDFGELAGIFFLPERPWNASQRRLEFTWRGVAGAENRDRRVAYGGNGHTGYIVFEGDGRIRGEIDWDGGHSFEGWRISGQQTRSEINAYEMGRQWDNYRVA